MNEAARSTVTLVALFIAAWLPPASAACRAPQRDPDSRKAAPEAASFTVRVHHAAGEPCADLDAAACVSWRHWVVKIGGADGLDLMRGLDGGIRKEVDRARGKPLGAVIETAPTTPITVVHRVVVRCANADLARADLRVSSSAGQGELQRLWGRIAGPSSRRSGPETQIQVKLAWKAATRSVERSLAGRTVPSGEDGDALLTKLIRDSAASLKAGSSTPMLVVEADDATPISHVANLMRSVRRELPEIEVIWKVNYREGAIGLGPGTGAGAGGGSGAGSRPAEPAARTLTAARIMRRNALAGSTQATEKVVMAGLEWLRRHQSPDGSWDCDGYHAQCDSKPGAAKCQGTGVDLFDTGVTGLALLAFLAAGFDDQRPSGYQETVAKGLKKLAAIQDPQGCFGSSAEPQHTYSHACATLAMCEAFDATRDPEWRKSAQRALAYIQDLQNPYKGWRYGKQPGDNDSSVTGWMLMAFKAAKDGGLPVNERTVKDGLAFVDSVTDEDTGRTGYIMKGEWPVRPEGQQGKFPSQQSESLTALAMCSRFFLGRADTPLTKAATDLLSKRLPTWDETSGSVDMYYWYYGTLAMFQVGGAPWERWNKSMKLVAVDHQVKKGCAEGSWDPKDPWGEAGGRVYSTALMTMCLEVYYRYPRPELAKKPK